MDLGVLLQSMAPVLDASSYVFVTLDGDYGAHAELAPLASFAEAEGLSAVVLQSAADANGLDYDGVFRCIKLSVHSNLQAVGLTAAVATALTEADISANVIAATQHDYVFVPETDSATALTTLQNLSAASRAHDRESR